MRWHLFIISSGTHNDIGTFLSFWYFSSFSYYFNLFHFHFFFSLSLLTFFFVLLSLFSSNFIEVPRKQPFWIFISVHIINADWNVSYLGISDFPHESFNLSLSREISRRYFENLLVWVCFEYGKKFGLG